jgi:two-component system response regulator AtoC
LLRALQEGTIERLGSNRQLNVDMRVVAATNRDPMQAVKEGKLREDLYYRLNVFRIDLPPLRDRISDIKILARHFLKKRNISMDESVTDVLESYTWPGNIRELENVLERAAIVCDGQSIKIQNLPADLLAKSSNEIQLTPSMSNLANLNQSHSLPEAIQAVEIQLISEALKHSNGNKSRAAKLLDISERSLWYKLSRYHLTGNNLDELQKSS